MLKNIILAVALVLSCIYMVLFWVSNPKANKMAAKIQKPFVIVSGLLLVLYIVL